MKVKGNEHQESMEICEPMNLCFCFVCLCFFFVFLFFFSVVSLSTIIKVVAGDKL